MPLEAGLLEILACPACHSPLRESPAEGTDGSDGTNGSDGTEGTDGSGDGPGSELVCTGKGCGLAYPVRDGIPVLLVDEARRPAH